MELAFHTLDVFTAKRFGGNPLAVVLDADALTAAQMQTVTREFNLSETIFVQTPADRANTAKVRIFCPASEMPFAGHPTVGCAILLAEMKVKPGCAFETVIRLEEAAGLVPVKVTRIGDIPRAMFTAPVIPYRVGDAQAPSEQAAAEALGLAASDIGFGDHAPGVFEGGPRFLYVPLKSRTALAAAKPSGPAFTRVTAAAGTDNIYVYTRGGERPGTAFRARMFAPAAGIPEDPATGSATALLAAQLLDANHLADGTHRFELEQGYEMGRPSDLSLELDVRAHALDAVRVAGQAVRVQSGTISI
ncbi:PhzF family phenazine biosynthesis protein [soil metagenome]